MGLPMECVPPLGTPKVKTAMLRERVEWEKKMQNVLECSALNDRSTVESLDVITRLLLVFLPPLIPPQKKHTNPLVPRGKNITKWGTCVPKQGLMGDCQHLVSYICILLAFGTAQPTFICHSNKNKVCVCSWVSSCQHYFGSKLHIY